MADLTEDQVLAFARLFQGRRDAYGLRHGESVKTNVTRATYRQHLEGQQAIGIYPVTDDATCHFAAVDFDRVTGKLTPEEIDRLALHDARRFMEECGRFGLNRMYLERSKRKGAHAWVFFAEPVVCADIRRVFTAALEAAQISQYELFPKQDRVTETSPLGNYINLPYPGGNNREGRQMMLDPVSERPIALADFLDAVVRFEADDLALILTELPEKVTSARTFEVRQGSGRRGAWYPCATPLLNISLAEHDGRNDLGFLIAKRLHMTPIGEAARSMFDDWNSHNGPPLTPHEADRVWEQGGKYTSMGCERIRAWQGGAMDAVRETCVETCPIHPSRGLNDFARLRKAEFESPVYYVSVGGHDVRLSVDAAWSYPGVQKAVFAQLNLILPSMKATEWRDTLQTLLDSVEVIAVPAEATESGQLWAAIREFLQRMDDDEDKFDLGLPLQNESHVYFTQASLRSFLRGYGFQPKASDLWTACHAHGAEHDTKWINGKSRHVWMVPLEEVKSA